MQGPAPTIRLRLTVLYGLVFLITGAVLLTIGYGLVRSNVSGGAGLRAELHKLGLAPPAGATFFEGPGGAVSYLEPAMCRYFAPVIQATKARLMLQATPRDAEFGLRSAVNEVSNVVLLPALLAQTRIVTLWDLLFVKFGKDPHKTVRLFHGLRRAQQGLA